ncbi:MAG: YihA family ribosome biogenesis GTP-binding protein [Bacteroidales bacterium]|nr:YihA family ribosome biogenesis GTP-binding protein [Bacteroidales bacterium]
MCSSPDYHNCPAPGMPEYAFIGRSNVGKSSLINMLTGQKELARTSSTPGKTRLINHFLIDENWYLTDLPGYGFARISRSERTQWLGMIRDYLQFRKNLLATFLLVDARLEPQRADTDFIHWMGSNMLPFLIVFTKSDKLSGSKLDSNLSRYRAFLHKTWEELPRIITASSVNGLGKDEILDFIKEANTVFRS